MDSTSAAITLATFVIVLAVGGMVYGEAINGELEAYGESVDKQVEWCEDNGGEAYNANSVAHGGLHCELPDGTVAHLWKVQEAGYPSDPATLSNIPYGTHGSTPWFGLGSIVPTFLAVVGLAVGIVAISPYLPGKAGRS